MGLSTFQERIDKTKINYRVRLEHNMMITDGQRKYSNGEEATVHSEKKQIEI